MFQIACLKIICTDSTEILFSKLKSAGLNYHLPKQFFSLTLILRGVCNKHWLLTLSFGVFFLRFWSINALSEFKDEHYVAGVY